MQQFLEIFLISYESFGIKRIILVNEIFFPHQKQIIMEFFPVD